MFDFLKDKLSLAWAHRGFQRYFKNTSWLLAEKILRILAGIFVGAYVARYLGPERYGILSYAIAFTGLFGGLGRLRIGEVLIRELVRTPDDLTRYLGTAFWIKVAGASLAFVVIAVITFLSDMESQTKFYVVLIAFSLFFNAFGVIKNYFNSIVKGKVVSLCNSAQIVITSLLRIVLVIIAADLVWFVWAILFNAVTFMITLLYAYRHEARTQTFIRHFDFSLAKHFLKVSAPLILASAVAQSYMKIDQVMLKSMMDEGAVGLYSAAVTLSEGWYFVPGIILGSVFPAIVSAQKTSASLFFKRILYLFTLLFWVAVSVGLVITLVSEQIVYILFGEEFNQSAMVLNIHIWSAPFFFLASAWDKLVIASDKQKYIIHKHIFIAVVNIGLNFALIPHYGIYGAAWATALSYFLNLLFVPFLYRGRYMYKIILKTLFPIWVVKEIKKVV